MSNLVRAILIGGASVGLAACVQVPSRDSRHAISASGAGTAEALFRERVVNCALPLLAQYDRPGVAITYRYTNGDTRIEADDAALSKPLRLCATPEAGPRQAFSGKLTIWRQAPVEADTHQEERQR